MPGKSYSLSAKLFPVYAIASIAAILCVPYLVSSAPTVSDSYLFGYNNRVGVVLLLALVTIGAIWTRGFDLDFRGAQNARPVSFTALVISLSAVFLGCLTMYFLAGHLGGFGESSYEIDRIWLTSIGKRPYVDVCGHRWIPEVEDPPLHPRKSCRSTLWNKHGVDGRTRAAMKKVGHTTGIAKRCTAAGKSPRKA
jgi:hypothetical protein